MRMIERSSAFKRDYKRESRGRHGAALDKALESALISLTIDRPLEKRYRDHDLSGDWAGYRECHFEPDLLLIYRQSDDTLRLARRHKRRDGGTPHKERICCYPFFIWMTKKGYFT